MRRPADPLAARGPRRRELGQGRAPARAAGGRRRPVPGFPRGYAGSAAPRTVMWVQREIELDARPRGFHLVTRDVVGALPELGDVEVGLLHLLIQHTSASLALNENASPDVRRDFESY